MKLVNIIILTVLIQSCVGQNNDKLKINNQIEHKIYFPRIGKFDLAQMICVRKSEYGSGDSYGTLRKYNTKDISIVID